MKSNILIACLALSLCSCSTETKETHSKPERAPHEFFTRVRRKSESIQKDTMLSKHMGDVVMPLNYALAELKVEDPELYSECINSSSDEEFTSKLQKSSLFRKIAKRHGVNVLGIKRIHLLK